MHKRFLELINELMGYASKCTPMNAIMILNYGCMFIVKGHWGVHIEDLFSTIELHEVKHDVDNFIK